MITQLVKIIDLTESGEGIAKLDGKIIFVDQATIGDEVEIKLTKDLKNYAVGQLVKIQTPSPERIAPLCTHFGKCGSCQLLNLNYATQLRYKQNQLEQALTRIGGISKDLIEPIRPAEPELHYRNKVQIPIVKNGSALELGYYARGSHRAVDLKECFLEPQDFTTIVQEIKSLLQRHKLPVYNEDRHQGVLRHLFIRSSEFSREILLGLVVNTEEFKFRNVFLELLPQLNTKLKKYQITSFVLNHNLKRGNKILGNRNSTLWGKGFLLEKINAATFKISLNTFVQIHKTQAEKAYAAILDQLPADNQLIIDAYCGIGSLTLALASRAEEVVGIEENRQAVEDASGNARYNGLKNTTFLPLRFEAVPRELLARADILVMDPPRKGLEAEVIPALTKTNFKKIFYLSCNPATLARDLKLIAAGGKYSVKKVIPFDFFPQTTHVEALAILERNT